MALTTEVYGQHPARFTMTGQVLPTNLFKTEEGITQGLAKRLHKHALETLEASGFKAAVSGWSVTVYTIDASDIPSNRSYCVRWENEQGGSIEVIGILTRKGWPHLDHGLAINW
jgi:hypothetical protein